MKKPRGFQFIAGFVLGAVMFCGTAVFASGITVTPAASKIFVNGSEVRLPAYNIDGSHYIKIRDLAKTAGFSVEWDGKKKAVYISTDASYTAENTLLQSQETALAASPEIAGPAATPETADMSIDEVRAEIVRMTNSERVKAGVAELEILPELMETAQLKADDMAQNGYFGHFSSTHGTPGDLIRIYVPNVKALGENLSAWTETPEEAIRSIMDSPEHRAAIMDGRYSYIGVGIVENGEGGYLCVQHFCQI